MSYPNMYEGNLKLLIAGIDIYKIMLLFIKVTRENVASKLEACIQHLAKVRENLVHIHYTIRIWYWEPRNYAFCGQIAITT